MFLWENNAPTLPALDRVPDFPAQTLSPTPDAVRAHKVQAKAERPEIREIGIEAKGLFLAVLQAAAEFPVQSGERRRQDEYLAGRIRDDKTFAKTAFFLLKLD